MSDYYSTSALREALDDLVIVSNAIGVASREQRERLHDAVLRVQTLALRADIDLAAHRKPDRSAILRMAGNIAAGCLNDPVGLQYRATSETPADVVAENHTEIAMVSVSIAREIMRLVDAPEVKP